MAGHVMRRSNQDLERLIALGPKIVSTNVIGYDMARELLALRALERALRAHRYRSKSEERALLALDALGDVQEDG